MTPIFRTTVLLSSSRRIASATTAATTKTNGTYSEARTPASLRRLETGGASTLVAASAGTASPRCHAPGPHRGCARSNPPGRIVSSAARGVGGLRRQAPHRLDGPGQRLCREEEGLGVSELVHARDDPLERAGIAACGVVQALSAGEGVVACVRAFVGAVRLDRLPLEVADVDVVQERLLEERYASAPERRVRRLASPAEGRVDAGVKRDVPKLEPQEPRLLDAALSEEHLHRRVAVDTADLVQRRLAVPRDDDHPDARHQITNRSSRMTPAANRSSEKGDRSSVGSRPTTSSARCSPTAGACWKPWPEKPVA